jgi:hypothetical protein
MHGTGGTDVGVLDVRIWSEALPRASGEVDRVSGLHSAGTHGLARWPSTRIISLLFPEHPYTCVVISPRIDQDWAWLFGTVTERLAIRADRRIAHDRVELHTAFFACVAGLVSSPFASGWSGLRVRCRAASVPRRYAVRGWACCVCME